MAVNGYIPWKFGVEGDQVVIKSQERMGAAGERAGKRAEKGFQGASKGATAMNGHLGRVDRNLGGIAKGAGYAGHALAAMFAGRGTSAIADMVDDYSGMKDELNLATESQAEFNIVLENLQGIAAGARTEQEAVVELYGKTYRAAKNLGKSQKEVIQFTGTVTKSMKLGKISTEAQTAALIQLSQSLGKGNLDGDEYKSISENAQGLVNVLVQGLGLEGKGALDEMAAAGELTAERVIDAVNAMAASVDGLFGDREEKIREFGTIVGDSYQRWLDNILELLPVLGAVNDLADSIAENIDILGPITAGFAAIVVGRIGIMTLSMLGLTGATKQQLIETRNMQQEKVKEAATHAANAKAVALEIQANNVLNSQYAKLAQAKDRAAMASAHLAQEQGKLNKAIKATSMTSRMAAGSMALMGGPVGLGLFAAVTVMSALPGIMGDTTTAFDVQKTAVDDYLKSLGKTVDKLNELSTAERGAASLMNIKDIETAEKEYARLSGEMIKKTKFLRRDLADVEYSKKDGGSRGMRVEFKNNENTDALDALNASFKEGKISAAEYDDQLKNLASGAGADFKGLAYFATELVKQTTEVANKLNSMKEQQKLLDAPLAKKKPSKADAKQTLNAAKVIENYERRVELMELELAKGVEIAKWEGRRADLMKQLGDKAGEHVGEVDKLLAREKAAAKALNEKSEAEKKSLEVAREKAKLAEEVKSQQDNVKIRIADLEREQEIKELILAGEHARADVISVQSSLKQQFPLLAAKDLKLLEDILIAERKRTREQKEQAKAKQSIDELSDFFFESMTREGANIWDIFRDGGKTAIADIMAEFATNGTVDFGGIMANNPIGKLLGGTDGEGGLLNGLDQILGTNLGELSGAISGLAGGAGMGSQVAGLVGGDQTIGAITGGIGSAIGNSILPGVGGFIGSALGGLGGLFGMDSKAAVQFGTNARGDLSIKNRKTVSDGDIAQAEGLADTIIGQLTSLAESLGGSVRGGLDLGVIGYRDEEFKWQSSFTNSSDKLFDDGKTFKTAEEAVAWAISDAIKKGAIEGIDDPQVAKKLKEVNANNIQQVLGELGNYLSISGAIADRMMEVEDPLTASLSRITDEFEAAVKAYQSVGADMTDMTNFFAAEQVRMVEEYRVAMTSELNGFLDELNFGQFSGLTDYERFYAAEAEFMNMRADVLAGVDVDDGTLAEMGQSYLTAAQSIFASSSDFADVRDLVADTVGMEIDRINEAVTESVSTFDLIQPIEEQTQILQDGFNGIIDGLQDLSDLMGGRGQGGRRRGGGNGGDRFSMRDNFDFV